MSKKNNKNPLLNRVKGLYFRNLHKLKAMLIKGYLKLDNLFSSIPIKIRKLVIFGVVIVLILGFIVSISFLWGASSSDYSNSSNKNKSNIDIYKEAIKNGPIKPVTGLVRSISANDIEIDSSTGQIVKVSIVDKTRVTKNGKDIEISYIKRDDKVTVYILESDSDGDVAGRIVLYN